MFLVLQYEYFIQFTLTSSEKNRSKDKQTTTFVKDKH